MSDQLQDYRRIVLDCDFVNDWVPPIIASTGDLNGRIIVAKVTNNGSVVAPSEKLHAQLLVNPKPNDEGYFGDYVSMEPVSGYETAAFSCAIPYGAVSKPGRTRMGVAFLADNDDGTQDIICTRPFNVEVEQGVLRVDSDSAIGEFEENVKKAQAAAEAAKQSETNAAQSASDAAESASQAADSAEAAAESERNAAQSASQAATSATTAGEHETAAGNSARAAAESASQAAGSAAAAAESASQAAGSASAAGASASNAATSESNAKQSETNAASSATKAATSETNAKASETAAKQSQTNAASSATQAGESAENASQSATAASQSASQAATSASQAAGSASAAKRSETNAASSASDAAESASQARDLVENFNLTVGETATSEPGTNAVVEITKQGTVYTADFTIPRGEQGPRGENTAAISSVTGSVDNNVGVPSVDVVAGGTPEQRTLDFQFHNLKGTHNGAQVWVGWEDPTAQHASDVMDGDLWLKSPHYLTEIDPDNPTPGAGTATYYTYSLGEKDNSPSVLITLDSVVTELFIRQSGVWSPMIWHVGTSLTPGSTTPDKETFGIAQTDAKLLE